jgi:hypothetical protein
MEGDDAVDAAPFTGVPGRCGVRRASVSRTSRLFRSDLSCFDVVVAEAAMAAERTGGPDDVESFGDREVAAVLLCAGSRLMLELGAG